MILFSLTVFAQKPKTALKTAVPKTKLIAETNSPSGGDKEEFTKAAAVANAEERVKALQKFVKNFPQSSDKRSAQELIVSARAAVADEKLRLSETENGTRLFRLAVAEAPTPLSDKLFSEVLLQFPTNLFFRGERAAALEIARMIEAKAEGNARQLLGLATFYIGVESAAEAERLASKALAVDPNLPAAYQTLALAHRVNFQLEESAAAYAKALELDPESIVSRRSLAEMKRAVGKPLEAAALYREILVKDAADNAAQTGLTLALFDANQRAEAETEMARALVVNPNNLSLLVGAGYWYAANGDGAKAVEYAEKAVAVEPRYTWAHIALARGYLQQKRPLDAERTLLAARQYGNFPTLDYEIAAARLMAGFYREAAEILAPNFAVKGEIVQTRLGNRVAQEATDFVELLALERRASIFQPQSADDAQSAEKLKSLLDFSQKLASPQIDETALGETADRFVQGEDKMQLHRQIFVANQLLQNKKALPKVLELTQAALGKADAALDVPNASAAVLADELYESRSLAAARNQNLLVPIVPRQTLSAVLRGRIEEIAGWTLYEQNKTGESVVRLKRAVSVLPENSAWWRSSMWRLGAALQADGKDKEALDAYFKSYPKETGGNAAKYTVVAALYQKVNGTNDGLEAQIGARPEGVIFTSPAPKPAETIAQNIPPITTPIETASNSAAENQPAAVNNGAVKQTADQTPEIKEPIVAPIENKAPVENKTVTAPENTQSTPVVNQTPTAAEENLRAAESKTQPTETKAETAQPAPTVNNAAQIQPENNRASDSEQTPTRAQQNKLIAESSSELARTIFEPVVISVPRRELSRNPPTRAAKEKTASNTDAEQNAASNPESTTASAAERNLPAENSASQSAEAILARPRVVVTENITAEKPENTEKVEKTESATITPCTIQVGQENISLLNNGGSLGILVGYKGKGDLKQLKAISNSPNDVEIIFDPGIGEINNRAFFVVKSISANKGVYTASFEAPCGKKDIVVRVR